VDILKITGERIRSLVLGRGYSSIELFAHEHGIPKSTLSELLSGKNDPKLTTLAKICAGLEISLAELLCDPHIDLWVREKAPHYDVRMNRQESAMPGRKPVRRA
jgi:transcriptional regulator with XRE-family HTH domain